MKVLITVAAGADLSTLRGELLKLGCTVSATAAVPVSGGEVTLEADCPAEARDHVRRLPGVGGVYPSSTMTPY